MSLLDRWVALAGPGSEPTGRELLDRYAEPQRRYHNQRHLTEVLDALALIGGDRPARLAAWFHDAVYDPRLAYNEDRSASLAVELLDGLRFRQPEVAEVARLIRLTADHRTGESDASGAALCDADLAILGADAVRYDDYATAIRVEYRHVPDAQFASGRLSILDDLLGREPLYRTELGHRRWQPRARANLSRERDRWAG